MLTKYFALTSFLIGLLIAPLVSHAAIDVSAAVTQITTDGTAAITAVGTALIGLAALSLVFRWVKATFF